jgi:hypothetical protein
MLMNLSRHWYTRTKKCWEGEFNKKGKKGKYRGKER